MATDTVQMGDLPPSEPQSQGGGEMTLIEHLLELRSRVTWMAVAVVLGMAIFFVPQFGFKAIEYLLSPARQSVPDFRPQFIEPMENIAVYFRVALLGGLTLAMPVIVYHIMRFVTPALTTQEKKWVFPITLGASFAFICGLAFGFWVVLPFTLKFLLTFGDSFAQADWRIGNYIDFVTRILLVMGAVFETPLIVMGLAKFGVISARQLLRWWRYAIILAFVIAAVVTPTIDPVTQSLVGGPIVVLYFVGIGLAWLVRR
ncbi:MAG: twin-arginine translocase subunit TatC [Dehalococcoidia bacterium]|nr:twin-arginine translocase subunit TatC [Dehalococcoidia bacterium]MCA9849605.1 twin-arginine translocase subunit TatC [Dehalococcoidia bacterium]MCA9856416.1 twin-arginine translocase subunit TatC [Dehalococcoidia bacterium]MCB9490626.1 twin-arginine translocase subunit TatC [Dehalococcoidia bacterium]